MGNVLEFFVKMRDMMSGGLAKLSANAKASFTKIQQGIDQTEAKANKLSSSFKNIGSGASAGGGGLLAMAGKLGIVTAALTALTAAASLGGQSIRKAMDFGTTVKSFEVLTGDKAKGGKLAGDLNKLQQDTILGPSVFQNAQTMMGFGIKDSEVIPNLKMLGDVSMGSVDKLNSLTLAFSQVQAAGKLTGQDLLQFINAGFNPLNEISKLTGISIGDLKKKMEEGAISADMITAAFKSATGQGGLYNNMLNKLAETPAGKMAQLQGQWESFQVKLGEALMPLAEMAMQFATPLIDLANSVLPSISAFMKGLTEPTGAWGEWLSIAKMHIQSIWGGLSHVLSLVWNVIKSLVTWIAKSELLQDVFWGIEKVLQGVWWVLGKIADGISWLWDHTIMPILNGIEKAYRWVKSLVGGDSKESTISGEVTITSKTAPSTALTTNDIKDNNLFKGLGGGAGKKTKSESGNVASGITGGGPRTINISGVKFMEKLADKLEINNQGDWNNVEEKLQNMFLRILNSGASVK